MAKKETKEKEPEAQAPAPAEQPAPAAAPAADPAYTEAEQKEVRIIERIIENKEIAPQDAFGKMTRSQIELLKRTIAKGATDDELRMFIQVCKGANLNPFMKQVHLIPRWDSKEGKEVRAIQVSIDGFRAIAEESGAYAGNEDPVYSGEMEVSYTSGKEKTAAKVKVPEKATVTVYKIVQGQRFAFTATARWTEYYPGSKMGFQWHSKPYLMLGKCAEALALRKAFPKLLSGMYAAEEMDKGASEGSEVEQQQKNFAKLKDMLQTASLEEIKDYQAKMKASTKYTAAQKAEFKKLSDARIKELTPVAEATAETKK